MPERRDPRFRRYVEHIEAQARKEMYGRPGHGRPAEIVLVPLPHRVARDAARNIALDGARVVARVERSAGKGDDGHVRSNRAKDPGVTLGVGAYAKGAGKGGVP